MAFAIPMCLESIILDQLFDSSAPQGCRASCVRPMRPSHAPRSSQPAELRELDDSYVLFVDLPGFSREQVTVKVEDGFLIVIATPDKTSAADEASPAKVLLAERQRRVAVNRRWKLAKDALLDGIHATLRNGELVILVPKRTHKVPDYFVVPVLGSDAAPAGAQQAQVAPAAEAPALPAAAASPASPAAPAEAAAAVPEVAMADAKEDDGSWEDVSEEERDIDEAAIRAKGKMPMEGPVLEEIQRQEAERVAQMQHDSDSD